MSGGQSYQGFAIASLVLGIVAFFACWCGPIFGIAALIFGAVANNGMKKSKNFEGKGMAMAGMIMGIIAAVLWTIFIIIYFIVVASAVNQGRVRQF